MTVTLDSHRKIWKKKPILREIYRGWYERIIRDLIPGKTLEIGSGSGNFKEFKPDIISSDIEQSPWLDRHFDAHKIPFKNQTVSNIVLIDTLHHLKDPVQFIKEARRVLVPGGRIILLEPFPSPISLLVYWKFHPEPFHFNIDYFRAGKENKKDPGEANQAIPYLLFFRQTDKFKAAFPGLKIIKKEKLSFIAYPLSGGFENKQLIPDSLFSTAYALEFLLKPFRSLLAFRCYVVLEKIYHSESDLKPETG
jgi:SAM-dependent methyltransferase